MIRYYMQILKVLGLKKKHINKESFQKLASIYSSYGDNVRESNKCTPVYRDIIIFKKDDTPIGISRVCFQCQKDDFIGSLITGNTLGQ